MMTELQGILKGVPVILTILVDNFWVAMDIKFALIFTESNVINVIEVVNDFLSVFLAECLDLVRKSLLVQKTYFENKNMTE
jgi:hypothetical protein